MTVSRRLLLLAAAGSRRRAWSATPTARHRRDRGPDAEPHPPAARRGGPLARGTRRRCRRSATPRAPSRRPMTKVGITGRVLLPAVQGGSFPRVRSAARLGSVRSVRRSHVRFERRNPTRQVGIESPASRLAPCGPHPLSRMPGSRRTQESLERRSLRPETVKHYLETIFYIQFEEDRSARADRRVARGPPADRERDAAPAGARRMDRRSRATGPCR